MKLSINIIEDIKLKYGENNCQIIGRNCLIISFKSNLTLFYSELELNNNKDYNIEVILNIDGIEKDLSELYQSSYQQSLLLFCEVIEKRYLHENEYENNENNNNDYNNEDINEYNNENCDMNENNNDNYNDNQEDILFTKEDSINSIITNRNLIIYTWGNSIRKHKPIESQLNFNVIPIVSLNRQSGLNLKKLNGTNYEIQTCLFQNKKFNSFIDHIVTTIESDPSISSISINCKNGIHRSVAVAEILKNEYFSNATIIHLELGHHSHRR